MLWGCRWSRSNVRVRFFLPGTVCLKKFTINIQLTYYYIIKREKSAVGFLLRMAKVNVSKKNLLCISLTHGRMNYKDILFNRIYRLENGDTFSHGLYFWPSLWTVGPMDEGTILVYCCPSTVPSLWPPPPLPNLQYIPKRIDRIEGTWRLIAA